MGTNHRPAPRLTTAGVLHGTIGIAAAAAIVVAHRASPSAAALGAFAVVLTVISVIDAQTERIPNRIVRPLTAATLAGVVIAGVTTDNLGRSGGAIGAGLAVGGVFWVLTKTGGLYMGDVRLSIPIAIVAGWFGLTAIATTLMVTTSTGAIAASVLAIRTRSRTAEFAYGPFLVLGSMAGLLQASGGL